MIKILEETGNVVRAIRETIGLQFYQQEPEK